MRLIYKSRIPSEELLLLSLLHRRMDLPDKDKQHFFNLKKGYEGELQFDSYTEKLDECIVFHDLLLKSRNTLFQIDTLIIFADVIQVFEVKNYEGEYYFDQDKLFKVPQTEILNPLLQINRTESLLCQLLHDTGLQLPIKSHVFFVNPEFTLFQAPLTKSLILPSQINRFLKKLNAISSKLDSKHRIQADQLVSLHMTGSSYRQLPSYDVNQLRKGVVCGRCGSFSMMVVGQKCVCQECGHMEMVVAAVLRSVEEFKILFPDQKLATIDGSTINNVGPLARFILNRLGHGHFAKTPTGFSLIPSTTLPHSSPVDEKAPSSPRSHPS